MIAVRSGRTKTKQKQTKAKERPSEDEWETMNGNEWMRTALTKLERIRTTRTRMIHSEKRSTKKQERRKTNDELRGNIWKKNNLW